MKLPEGQVILGEFTRAELAKPSGIFDEQRGRELSNYEAVEFIERAQGAQGIYTNQNGLLSDHANDRNSEVTRASHGVNVINWRDHTVALVSQRPPREFIEPSGIFDEQLDRELTNLEAVRFIEGAFGARDMRVKLEARARAEHNVEDHAGLHR